MRRSFRDVLNHRKLRNIDKVARIDSEKEIGLNYEFLTKNLCVGSLDEGSYIARYQGIVVFPHRKLDAKTEAVIH